MLAVETEGRVGDRWMEAYGGGVSGGGGGKGVRSTRERRAKMAVRTSLAGERWPGGFSLAPRVSWLCFALAYPCLPLPTSLMHFQWKIDLQPCGANFSAQKHLWGYLL